VRERVREIERERERERERKRLREFERVAKNNSSHRKYMYVPAKNDCLFVFKS
jgi:hypothetical protein